MSGRSSSLSGPQFLHKWNVTTVPTSHGSAGDQTKSQDVTTTPQSTSHGRGARGPGRCKAEPQRGREGGASALVNVMAATRGGGPGGEDWAVSRPPTGSGSACTTLLPQEARRVHSSRSCPPPPDPEVRSPPGMLPRRRGLQGARAGCTQHGGKAEGQPPRCCLSQASRGSAVNLSLLIHDTRKAGLSVLPSTSRARCK